MASLTAVAGVVRAPFLLLPIALVASGSAAAAYRGSFVPARAVIALLGLLAVTLVAAT